MQKLSLNFQSASFSIAEVSLYYLLRCFFIDVYFLWFESQF